MSEPTIVSAILNGAILSVPFAAAVSAALALMPRRALNAATRDWIWRAALAVVIALPLVYLPKPISIAQTESPRAILIAPASPSLAAASAPAGAFLKAPLPRAPRLPLNVPIGAWISGLALLWCATSLLLLIRLAIGYVLLARRAARAVELPDRAGAWIAHCGSSRRIRVARSNDVSAPIRPWPVPSVDSPALGAPRIPERAGTATDRRA